MLSRLSKRIKATNAYQVASELGFRSPNTILNWIRDGYVPKIRVDIVAKYLKTN